MRQAIFKQLVPFLALVFAVLPLAVEAQTPENGPKRLRAGVIVAGDDTVRNRVEPFRFALEDIVNMPVDLFLMETMGDAVEAVSSGRIDYVRLSPSAYAASYQLCECVEPLVTAGPDDFPARFHAILVTLKKEAQTSLADLEGKRLAVGSKQAVTGYRVPIANLAADGLNARKHFSALVEVTDPMEGLRAVLEGRVHATVAWSTLAGEAKNGYTAGTLNDFYVSGNRAFDKLEIVWRSPPIPYSAHTVRKNLPDALKRELRSGLMDLRRENPSAYLAIEPDLPGGFEPVVHGDYRPVLRTYEGEFLELLNP